jgi:hypothetical protein
MRRALRWLGRNSGTIFQIVTVIAALASPSPVRDDRDAIP